MDQLTSSGERIYFARVCVNIQAESSFLESFFITSEGESVEIRMEYQGVPTMCSHCCVFGHETKICLSAQVSKLSETQVSNADNPSKEDGWTTIKNKGKRKVGEPRLAISPVLPVEISSSSAEGGIEMRTVTAEDFSTKATAQVEIVLSAALDIAKLSHPGAGEIFQGVEKAAVLGELSTVVPFSHIWKEPMQLGVPQRINLLANLAARRRRRGSSKFWMMAARRDGCFRHLKREERFYLNCIYPLNSIYYGTVV